MRKARYEKNLKIGVRFDGATFSLLDGTSLPKLRKNAVGELLLPPEAIEDEDARARLSNDRRVLLLEQNTFIYIGVSPSLIEKPDAKGLLHDPRELGLQTEYWLVEAQLKEPLYVRVRGDDEARLEKCICEIPAVGREATSVNHAFTIASETYETKRLSHTGNVFERVFTEPTSGQWHTLGELRAKAILTLPSENPN
jgi:hypothetical protein